MPCRRSLNSQIAIPFATVGVIGGGLPPVRPPQRQSDLLFILCRTTNNGKKIVCFVLRKKISYIYNIYVQKLCITKKNWIDRVSINLPCKKYWLCILIRYNIIELRLTLYMFCSWFLGTQKKSRCSGFFFILFPCKNIAVPLWLGKGHVTSII